MVSEWVVVFWSFQCKVQLHSHKNESLVSLFKHFASQEVHSVRLVLSHSVFVSSCLFANLGNFVSVFVQSNGRLGCPGPVSQRENTCTV